jgi:hypothetical protein
MGEVLRTETPPAGTTGSIWEDRVLMSGFEAFGGIPDVVLVDEIGSVPAAVMKSLSDAVQPAL